jgi:hypothetical protein
MREQPEDEAIGADTPARSRTLRERTHEIELIISGLTTVALFALPGWLLDRYVDIYPHVSVGMAVAGEIGLMIASGLCYTLGLCFLMHLMARAYWVGLIGLKSVFPGGIDWRKTPGIGPLQRDFYRQHLPDLATAIERADRLASTLFSVIGLVAISVLWIGVLISLAAVVGAVIGGRIGHTQAGLYWAMITLVSLSAGLPIVTLALDSLLGRRFGARPGFRALIAHLTRAYGLFYPQRLILPVQLTLQSNTRPWIFVVALTAGTVALMLAGQLNWRLFNEFTLGGEYRHLTSADVRTALRSSHYEDQRTTKDRVRLVPMIPSLRQSDGFVPLFLPYHPLRDNLVLERLCGDQAGPDCLRRLWRVELDGREVPMAGFLASERLDLGLRGLTGFVSTAGLAPGLHRLEVTWNPSAAVEDVPPDDRLSEARFTFSIPFLFAPDFELELDDSGRVPLLADPGTAIEH